MFEKLTIPIRAIADRIQTDRTSVVKDALAPVQEDLEIGLQGLVHPLAPDISEAEAISVVSRARPSSSTARASQDEDEIYNMENLGAEGYVAVLAETNFPGRDVSKPIRETPSQEFIDRQLGRRKS